MRLRFQVIPHVLKFRFEAGTSRGSFTEKPTWFIKAVNQETGQVGWGEASPLKGLSKDYVPDYSNRLEQYLNACEGNDIPETEPEVLEFVSQVIPAEFPSIRFGLETALLDIAQGGGFCLFNNDFAKGKNRIPINGLVWMGDESFMRRQIEEKLKAGFGTIKMKIGAIDFSTELSLLESIRKHYTSREITLRVDANGAFDAHNVYDHLHELAALEIHSIEQPVAPGQWSLMAELCQANLIPIALDEELIGVHDIGEKVRLLETIRPQYIILKPSLVGGIGSSREWINLANSRQIGWWMTSMLESNIGLNAIAQFTAQYTNLLPQGLGTGQLYHNNVPSPLTIRGGQLLYDYHQAWTIPHALQG